MLIDKQSICLIFALDASIQEQGVYIVRRMALDVIKVTQRRKRVGLD